MSKSEKKVSGKFLCSLFITKITSYAFLRRFSDLSYGDANNLSSFVTMFIYRDLVLPKLENNFYDIVSKGIYNGAVTGTVVGAVLSTISYAESDDKSFDDVADHNEVVEYYS